MRTGKVAKSRQKRIHQRGQTESGIKPTIYDQLIFGKDTKIIGQQRNRSLSYFLSETGCTCTCGPGRRGNAHCTLSTPPGLRSASPAKLPVSPPWFTALLWNSDPRVQCLQWTQGEPAPTIFSLRSLIRVKPCDITTASQVLFFLLVCIHFFNRYKIHKGTC